MRLEEDVFTANDSYVERKTHYNSVIHAIKLQGDDFKLKLVKQSMSCDEIINYCDDLQPCDC